MTEKTTDISWLSCGVTEINMKREFAMGENKNRITSSKDKTGSKNKFNTEKNKLRAIKFPEIMTINSRAADRQKPRHKKATNVRSSANVAVVSTLIFHTRSSWK